MNIDDSYFTNFCPIDPGCEFTHLSCRFLLHLTNVSDNKAVVLKPYSTLDDARAAVVNGDAWGLVSMTSNFSAAMLERMFNMLEADANTRNLSKINVSLFTRYALFGESSVPGSTARHPFLDRFLTFPSRRNTPP